MKLFLAFLCMSASVFSQNNTRFFVRKSPYSFERTILLFEEKFKEKNLQIFAKINHSQAAEQVNETLPPTLVFVVGNPKVGTPLMQENPIMAIHLPLKILISEENGQVLVTFENISFLTKKYPYKKGKEISKKIDAAMQQLISLVVQETAMAK